MNAMKKSALSLIVLFASIICVAQDHLSFKGLPIEGSMTGFCQKLSDKGFVKLGCEDNTTLFMGDFTGREATVGVTSDDDGENVHSVVVYFESSKDWNVLVDTYSYYKNLYARKYGQPKECIESNRQIESGRSNAGLMAELHLGRVTWSCLWEVAGGEIEMSIEKASGFYKGLVVLRYRDAQNEEARIQKHLEEI